MVIKRYDGARGEVRWLAHESRVLRDNSLGDPHRRRLFAYLPAGHVEGRRYPVLFALAGFTGSGLGLANWQNFSESLPERLDRLMEDGTMGPCVVVGMDGFTSLGGNQYINSSAVGRYADYLIEELIPFVEAHLPVLPGRAHRGLFGKSSGGYGALMHGMLYPEVWNALACHSGDMYFEYGYKPDFPLMLDVLAQHGRSVKSFLAAFHQKLKPSGREIHALMGIAMSATYDPDPAVELGFHLPVDLYTGEIDPARWSQWLRWDPVERVADLGENLRDLDFVFLDCGSRDQYRLHYGARILHQRLEARGIAHVFEEFDDDHSSIDYRLDCSLPLLCTALQGQLS